MSDQIPPNPQLSTPHFLSMSFEWFNRGMIHRSHEYRFWSLLGGLRGLIFTSYMPAVVRQGHRSLSARLKKVSFHAKGGHYTPRLVDSCGMELFLRQARCGRCGVVVIFNTEKERAISLWLLTVECDVLCEPIAVVQPNFWTRLTHKAQA